MKPSGYRLALLAAAIGLTPIDMALAQSFKRGVCEFNCLRELAIPQGKNYSVVVTEFFTHGELTPDGKNLAVTTRAGVFVPTRVLQVGPGDFCRVAIQTAGVNREYDVLYGGPPVPEGVVPKWTNRDGLLMETRQYKECNTNNLEAIRTAFESSKPIGADYVDAVFHSHNPFLLGFRPFFTRYSGVLNIASTGRYEFFTQAIDWGCLVIDDKLVTSRRGRLRQAKPGTGSEVHLTAGPHNFEYFHASASPEAMTVAAWQINPPKGKDDKPKPESIPSDVWRPQSIGRVMPSTPMTRESKLFLDFLTKVEGEVPLPDNDVPLLGVLFRDTTSKALTAKGKVQWDFGDGQTSEASDPAHVYLRPGLYAVTLSVKRQPKNLEVTNRIYVDRPFAGKKDREHTLDEFLPILTTYNPRTLDVLSLRQLVLVYDAKASQFEAPPDEPAGGNAPPTPEQLAARRVEATKYVTMAVEAGKAAFTGESAAQGDDNLIRLARFIGPMARDRLGQSQTAFDIWRGAYQRVKQADLKAECAVEAADIAMNDLVKPAVAKPLLDDASKLVDMNKTGPLSANLCRVWADFHATNSDGKAAAKLYAQAETVLASKKNYIERTAWKGAHERSCEDYVKARELDRMAAELRLWQINFPTEKISGQLTLMYARYWAARQMYDQAIALSEQLLTVNPDSPYMDQLLKLAADCEVKRGKTDRALATLHSLVKDYPGSPLVPAVKEQIQKLESGDAGKPATPPKKPTRPASK